MPSTALDAGRARELQKSAQPATQMLSMSCLYQMNAEKRKGQFEKCVSLPIWCPPDRILLVWGGTPPDKVRASSARQCRRPAPPMWGQPPLAARSSEARQPSTTPNIAVASHSVVNLRFVCVSHTYRRENITDWAFEQFRARYHDSSITK
jgi:hypothetical protein